MIASRLRASAKNGKTSSGVPSRRCSRCRTWVRMTSATGLGWRTMSARPASAPRSRRCAPTTTCAGRPARRSSSSTPTSPARAARSSRSGCARPAPCASPSATSRCAPGTRARSRSRTPPRRRRARARSGRCTTRSTPTRAGSTTRTCGRAASALGLDVERFEADRRDPRVAERVRPRRARRAARRGDGDARRLVGRWRPDGVIATMERVRNSRAYDDSARRPKGGPGKAVHI